MAYRSKMKKKSSRRSFSKHSRTHRKNYTGGSRRGIPMRGGIRL